MSIDTLKFARRLQAAGIPAQQAEAQAEALNEAVRDGVATKADLLAVEERIAARLSALETRLIKHVSSQLTTVIALNAGITGLILAAAIAWLQMRGGH